MTEPHRAAARQADEAAPVDRQADPTNWLSARALVILVGVSVLILIITVVVCLLVWATPPMDTVPIPPEPQI